MILAWLAASAFAEAPDFKPEAQLRPRFEARSRDEAVGEDVAFFSQRARLGGTLSFDDVAARVVIQDVRLWGEEASTIADFTADHLDLHAAYLQVGDKDAWSLAVGRQPWAVHEHRLIGTVGWTQQGRAFDGGRFRWFGNEVWSIDAGAAMLATKLSPLYDKDSAMGFVRAGRSDDGSTVDVLYVPVFRPGGSVHTAGVYARGQSGALSGRVEAYAQLGSIDDTDVSAWMAGAAATVAPDTESKPKITLWYDHLSGDGDLADGTIAAFDTLFATNHKFYGLIDVMAFTVGGAVDGRGLQDAALKLSMSPASEVTTHLDAHLFLPSNAQGGDSVLGQEVDAWATWKATPGLVAAVGGAVLLRPDIDQPDLWGYVQLNAQLQ